MTSSPHSKAGLCTLASGDVEGAKVKVERYEDRAAYFRDSREAKLLKDVSGAVENEDADLFTEIIREYVGKPFLAENLRHPHRRPPGAVACFSCFLLTCALLMTSSHSKVRCCFEA